MNQPGRLYAQPRSWANGDEATRYTAQCEHGGSACIIEPWAAEARWRWIALLCDLVEGKFGCTCFSEVRARYACAPDSATIEV